MLDKNYDPQSLEQNWYQIWEARGYFSPGHVGTGQAGAYCIMIPPPNVTGSLHMGHGFNNTVIGTGVEPAAEPVTDHGFGFGKKLAQRQQLESPE